MGKNECLNAHWQSIGYEDGAKGYPASRIAGHRKACAAYDVTPDLESYNRGRSEGLHQWCTAGNGYYQGSRGAVYNGVCPEDLEPQFLQAYERGFAEYSARKEVEDLEAKIAGLHDELAVLELDIARIEEEIISEHVPAHHRRSLLDQLRAAENDRDLLLYEIADSQRLLLDRRSKLDAIEGGVD